MTASTRRSATLSLAVAQPRCHGCDVDANIDEHVAAVVAACARVVGFPELSLTGYELAAPVLAAADPRLVLLQNACAAPNAVALVGALVVGPHIAILAVTADDVRVVYRKCYPGAEEGRFAPGVRPSSTTMDGWRIGLGICRDTGFAEHLARTAALGIDIYAADTLMTLDETAMQDERGAAIAAGLQVWVAFASFAGSTGSGYDQCAGASTIWAPDGSVRGRAGTLAGATVTTVVT